MFRLNKRLAIVPVLLGLGLVATAATGGPANTPSAAAIECGVATQINGNMQSIEGVVLGKSALSGDYQFQLKSSGGGGSTNISQGGGFAAKANEITTLGQVAINADARYQLDFTITANGQKIDCNQRFDYRT